MMAVFPARLGGFLRRFTSVRQSEAFSFHHENVLGTSLEIRVRCRCRQNVEEAERRALTEIDCLERIFSSFDAASEFRRWQERRGQEIAISPELMTVLRACDHWQKWSVGAFNPASEAFSQLWKKAAQENRLPSSEERAVCAAQAARPLWRLNLEGQTAICLAECPLTLNSIAKGYICDRACEAAFENQEAIEGLVLNIGGDLRIRGSQEQIVGVTDPDNDAENAPLFSRVRLCDGAIATSGDWRRGFRIGETFYSHLVDPRSGMPVDQVRSASVVAPDAMTADVLATIFSVVSPGESVTLADSLPGVGCLLIAQNGGVHKSAEWRRREVIAGGNCPYQVKDK